MDDELEVEAGDEDAGVAFAAATPGRCRGGAAGKRNSSARSCPGAAGPSSSARWRRRTRRRPRASRAGTSGAGCGRRRGQVGQDVLGVVELDAGEVARVAADVGDDETGGFGSLPAATREPRWRRPAPFWRASYACDRPLASRHGDARRRSSEIGGREVTITNPDKVYFPEPGYTKLDLVRYYLAVADGALRGAGGRPMALKRFVDGDHEGAVLPEAGAGQHAGLDPDRRADVPVRADRRRDRPRRGGGAGVGRQPRLHRPEPAPGPGRGPRPSRRAAGRPRPGARASSGRRSATSRSSARRRSRRSGSSAGRRRPARAGSTSTSGSSRAGPTPRSAAPRWRWPATSSARAPRSRPRKWWKEERHGVFLDYNQNAKDRTVASAYSVRPLPDARVSMPLPLGRGRRRRGRGLHDRDGAGAVRGARRRRRWDRRGASARSRRCSSWRAATRRRAGRRAVAAELREAGRRAAAGPAVASPPAEVRVRARPRRGGRAAAGGRRGARGRRRGGRQERRAADRVAGMPPRARRVARADPDRPAQDVDPGHRDHAGPRPRPRRPRASSAGRPAIRRPPPTSSRPTCCRRDARPLVALVPRPGQPDPRPEADGPPRSRSTPTTTRGPATSGRTGRASSSGRRARSRRRRGGQGRACKGRPLPR